VLRAWRPPPSLPATLILNSSTTAMWYSMHPRRGARFMLKDVSISQLIAEIRALRAGQRCSSRP